MRYSKLFLVMLISVLPLFAACGRLSGIEDISSDWKVYLGDGETMAEVDFDDSDWKTITLPGLMTPTMGRQNIWLRKTVFISEDKKGTPLGFASGKIWDTETTYINGHAIGASGRKYPSFQSTWNHFRCYTLPEDFIKYGENNVIAIKVFSNQNPRFDGSPYIGELRRIQSLTFWRQVRAEYLPFALAVFILLFGVILLLQYLFYRSSDLYLKFPIMAILWFAISTHYYIPFQDSISYNLRDNLYYVFTALAMFFCYYFLEGLLKHRTRVVRYILLALSIITSIMCLTATPDDPITGWRFNVYGAFSFLLVIAFGWLLFLSLKDRNKEAFVLLGGYLAFVFSVLHDGLVVSGIIYNDYYYNYYGFPLMIICFGGVLSLRNSFIARKLEEYSKNLEKMVDERTAQLRQANSEIEAAMEEMEAINENLTETNRELVEAQRIMKLDMQMAINVQYSFFPKSAPVSDEWEACYAFKPMSGVSGDLYDFYTHNGKLTGVSIMDVSGHGIASGLITMIAKSIAFRNFTGKPDEKLSVILEQINQELIQELGGVDNYLTGIMLRFRDDMVEYVNAGHTELLFRNGETGAAKIVSPKNDRTFKGHFLGVEAMQQKYNVLTFRMRPGDSLLLYSDCLIESTDPDGEEFGIERVMQTLTDLETESDCQATLRELERRLFAHTRTETLTDDFTMMMIRRK